ncbi:hypothetical protein B841_02500 [Corynebacterium maris DSM 45190]|uniref:Small integral membrane protein n=1 Tax=Corynebacterium maris DSM 45190 TaxID=1224163 RepID=S5TH49_9CORY|nr:hypothetical protein [Corynebacterium maris]AGS33983.1 hypothetical protein B841_02500 [Corynebacterium maris DSM 45190]
MKNMTALGVVVGLAFAFAVIFGGFAGFLWALLFSAIGAVVGAHLDGRINLRAVFDGLRSGRGGRG